jgi:hypothetical protein
MCSAILCSLPGWATPKIIENVRFVFEAGDATCYNFAKSPHDRTRTGSPDIFRTSALRRSRPPSKAGRQTERAGQWGDLWWDKHI